MRRNGARIRVRDDPSKVRNEADSDIVAELKALTVGVSQISRTNLMLATTSSPTVRTTLDRRPSRG